MAQQERFLLALQHFDKALAVSLAAPFAIVIVWWFVRRLRRMHFGHGI